MNDSLSPSPTPHDLLDRVLVGQPDTVKVRVLELVMRLGIHPEDELFLVMIALNHLQVLVERAPEDWKTLFDHFSEELEAWTDTNIEILESLMRKAEADHALAESSKLLVSTLQSLTTVSNSLVTQLQKHSQNWDAPPPLPTSWLNALKAQDASINRLSNRFASQLRILNQNMTASHAFPGWFILLLFVLGAATLYNTWLLSRLSL